jgi:hypothetical protein
MGPSSSYVNRHFGGTFLLHLQGRKSALLSHLLDSGVLLGRYSILKMEVLRSYKTSVYIQTARHYIPEDFFNTFVSLAIPSLQLRLTTSLFSNLDSKLKTNSQYLSIDQCRALVLIRRWNISQVLPREPQFLHTDGMLIRD